jgi:hypothetical protein
MRCGAEWVISEEESLLLEPEAKVPDEAATSRPARVCEASEDSTVSVTSTVSPGYTVVAEAASVTVVELSALRPWQLPQPLVARPVIP